MKKIIACFLALTLIAVGFAGCAVNNEKEQDKKLSIVTTIFPEYDWVRQILGEHEKDSDITMLLDNGVDLHSYQPTTQDIIKISSCDMFIYVGGESDAWVENALKQATNKNMVVINLLDVLGTSVKEEEVIEGMQAEEEHEHEETEHEEHEEETEYDEHVWLSLKNAVTICNHITTKLSQIDTQNSDDYAKNNTDYTNKLKALDNEYSQAVSTSKHKTLLFSDRFPFRYMVNDYDLSYYAAFVGCSAETEASFNTIAFLSKKVDELGLNTVLTIEGTNHKIAQTIIQNTKEKNQQVLSMDSMQSVTSNDIKNGTTYISIMQNNLNVLKSALN